MIKKIMFVCQSLGNGGAERVVSVLTEALAENRYEVYVLPLTNREQTYQLNSQITLLSADIKSRGKKEKIDRIRAIRHAIKKNNIDIVVAFEHYNAMYSVVAAKGLKVKVVGSERNDPKQVEKKKFTAWLRLELYRHLDALICQTEDAKYYFPENIQRKSTVILNPISNNLPEPYTGQRTNRVVTFCRLEPQKNIPLLIEAFSILHERHENMKLDIYGQGSLKEYLEEYIINNHHQDYVTIHPFSKTIHDDVKDAMMFVLPSDYEGISNSMIESMAIGLPVIVTDCPCGGARTVITPGVDGILVPVRDVNAMSAAMIQMVEDSVLRNQLSANSVKIREKLASSVIAEQWKQVINSL